MYTALIVIGNALALASYLNRRIKIEILNPLAKCIRIFVSSPATIVLATVALVGVFLDVLHSSPGREQTRGIHEDRELLSTRSVGRRFGAKFAKAAPPQSKILVVDRETGNKGANYQAAFLTGLAETLAGKIPVVADNVRKFKIADYKKENAMNQVFNFDAGQLDAAVEEHPDCNIVISLLGLPTGYEGSKTWFKVQAEELMVGIYTDDVYLLGGMIFGNEIAACITPLERYSYDDLPADLSAIDDLFDSRYLFLDADNVFEITRKYRRLLKVSTK